VISEEAVPSRAIAFSLDTLILANCDCLHSVRLPRGYSHLPIEQVEHTAEENAPLVHSGRMSVVEEAAAWRLDALDKPSLSISTPSSRPHHSVSDHSTSSQHSGSGSGEDYLGTEDVLSLKNRTIVLVDDSRDLRTYMSSLLSTQFTVVPFADPFQALEFIKMNTPSLVVTDSMMPGLTGMELTQRIRQDPKTSLLPVIMVSAQAGSEARADALEGGVDDYLVKPFQPRELVARVRVHLQLGLMRVELEKRVEERTRALIDSESRNRALAERYSTLSTVSPVGIVQIDQEGTSFFSSFPRSSDCSRSKLRCLLSLPFLPFAIYRQYGLRKSSMVYDQWSPSRETSQSLEGRFHR